MLRQLQRVDDAALTADTGCVHDALEKFSQALEISQSIGYKKGIALANYGAGLVYRRVGDYVRAAEALHESAENF